MSTGSTRSCAITRPARSRPRSCGAPAPTQFDSGQSADGKHAAFMWEKLPYALGGDPSNWDAAKDEPRRGDARPVGGISRRVCANRSSAGSHRSPLDIEREFPNMAAGDLLVGAFYRRARSATIGRSKAPGITAPASAASISAARPPIPAATSPDCRATTQRRRSSGTWGLTGDWLPAAGRSAYRRTGGLSASDDSPVSGLGGQVRAGLPVWREDPGTPESPLPEVRAETGPQPETAAVRPGS